MHLERGEKTYSAKVQLLKQNQTVNLTIRCYNMSQSS